MIVHAGGVHLHEGEMQSYHKHEGGAAPRRSKQLQWRMAVASMVYGWMDASCAGRRTWCLVGHGQRNRRSLKDQGEA